MISITYRNNKNKTRNGLAGKRLRVKQQEAERNKGLEARSKKLEAKEK
jgi:hypothetical protein